MNLSRLVDEDLFWAMLFILLGMAAAAAGHWWWLAVFFLLAFWLSMRISAEDDELGR